MLLKVLLLIVLLLLMLVGICVLMGRGWVALGYVLLRVGRVSGLVSRLLGDGLGVPGVGLGGLHVGEVFFTVSQRYESRFLRDDLMAKCTVV